MADVTLEDSNQIQNVGWTTKYFRLRDHFEKCDEMLRLNEDDYVILKNGSIKIYYTNEIWPKERFCLYPQIDSDIPNSIWVIQHNCIGYFPPVKKSPNTFAWSMAAISTGVMYLVNLIWEEDLHKWNSLPLVGYDKCRLEARGPSYWIFFMGPEMILALFNVIMFILTVIHIWKNLVSGLIHISNFLLSYLIFLRLSVIMGVFWILDIFSLLQHYSFFAEVYVLVLYIESSMGILVFMLLILKRSTLKLLMER
ncbi:probable G-protein coupled receptor Mth-like 7 [Drosophila takahashii]|uniref:probable G-protein coupled receptor Mth-like 7 n=1 Tax=Drosophila takahashii TaxID=29030 RepID=UPI001CF84346|nr:probable G-protein coupled receptor Mth-like 7 [Drosophila takahashii]